MHKRASSNGRKIQRAMFFPTDNFKDKIQEWNKVLKERE